MLPKFSFSIRKAAVFSLAALVCAGLAGFTVARPLAARAFDKLGWHNKELPPPAGNAPAVAVRPSSAPKAQITNDQTSGTTPVVIVYATAFGFEPEDMTIPAGQTLFLVRNRTGLDKLTFTLTKPGLTSGSDGQLSAGFGQNTSLTKTFAPGDLTLSEAAHPEWTCHIKVNP